MQSFFRPFSILASGQYLMSRCPVQHRISPGGESEDITMGQEEGDYSQSCESLGCAVPWSHGASSPCRGYWV